MQGGDVLVERFEIDRLVGSGGMGQIYRALDRLTGAAVAIKVMSDTKAADQDRFARESRVLAELRHPAIVRHIAHGITPSGEAFLAMEWLEGEDLGQRLARAGLDATESLAVGKRLAEGLAVAHERGIVHRDIKPSNVFLVGGDPEHAKLLDFGIVRLGFKELDTTAAPLTASGVILGTVGYMSPEQATADRAIDARADVFSLGCLLFECFAGEPAFAGVHIVAVLAKVLREEPRPLRESRPELPSALSDLVGRMLQKDRRRRPENAAVVLRELAALGHVAGAAPRSGRLASPGLSGSESRLMSLTLAAIPDDSEGITKIVLRHGADQARLANNVLLLTHSERGTIEQVYAAAACALELVGAFPRARIALATGRAQTGGEGPTGPVIDAAASLLAGTSAGTIRIDDVTAGLIAERFEILTDEAGQTLLAPRRDVSRPRTLLGRATPFVGRDKELALLAGTLRECVLESVARAVLVTGPAGQGKSRLRHEFVSAVRESGDVAILSARSDPVGAGSSFLFVRQLIREAAQLHETSLPAEQLERLRSHLASISPQDNEVSRTTEFLAELVGIPSPAAPSPQLRASRNDPQIMAQWLRRSFRDWLSWECAAHPLLIVLEDVHWGDMPSLTYLGEALRELANRPFMVLALGRPPLHDMFPNLWLGLDKQEVSLSRLTPRAASRLVRAVLGTAPNDDAVARIVERADGNAFYLEELIRRVADGRSDELPETIAALVQSRLERLEPEARRVIRAASVFGEVFWQSGLEELLGATEDLNGWLTTLTERELLTASSGTRFPGEQEYAFRHGLLQEAAYAMLTFTDRVAAHRLAGEWLERAGEGDALTMADHFEKGGDPKRAVPWILRAAEAAYDGGNASAAKLLSERGMPHATGQPLGILKTVHGASAGALGDVGSALPPLREAMDLLPNGGRHWFVAATSFAYFGAMAGNAAAASELAKAIAELPPVAAMGGLYAWSAARVVFTLMFAAGQPAPAKTYLDRIEQAAAMETEDDLSFNGWRALARVYWNFLSRSSSWASAVRDAETAVEMFERVGDPLALANARFWQTCMAVVCGRHGEVERIVERGLANAAQSSNALLARHLEMVQWIDRVHTRPPLEVAPALERLAKEPTANIALHATVAHALLHLRVGNADRAEATARAALQAGTSLAVVKFSALVVLARVLISKGQSQAGLEAAQQALEMPVLNPIFDTIANPRLSTARALFALGRTQEAGVALASAHANLQRMADDMSERSRESYLKEIGDNLEIMTLVREHSPA